MTRTTGWLGNDEPDGQAPEPRGAGGFTGFLLANRAAPGQGHTLEQVLLRAAAAPDRGGPEPEDPDDRMAALVTRGYSPGLISQLSLRLADVSAARQAEEEKLERGVARAEQVRRMHERGQVRAWDIPAMLDDLGDEGEVARLQRQEASLRRQLDEAHAAMSPPEPRQLDGVEAASRRAHQVFAEVTRQRMAEAEAGVRRSEPRPFASGGAAGTEHTGPSCQICAQARRSEGDTAAYAPGSVITTGYREIAR